MSYSKNILTTQITALKKNLAIFHQYASQSGFGVDSRGVVTAAPSALNAYYAAHSGSSQFANAPLAFYEDLLVLFGRKNHFSSYFLLHHYWSSLDCASVPPFTGDTATGEYAKASVGLKRILDVCLEIAEQTASSVSCSLILSLETSPDSAVPVIAAVPSTVPSSTVRPYVKKLKTKQEGGVTELVREIIAAQERFHSRMTPYDKAMRIFQERSMFGLSTVEEARMITHFAESDSLVRQFLSYNEEQRDIFVQEKKMY